MKGLDLNYSLTSCDEINKRYFYLAYVRFAKLLFCIVYYVSYVSRTSGGG